VKLVPNTPSLPRPALVKPDVKQLAQYDAALTTALFRELAAYAFRLNRTLTRDGSEPMTGPLPLFSVTVVGLAVYPAADWDGSLVFVSNEAGGATAAYSDGTNWRRFYDNAVVS
jgi:hypothetical protein